MGVSTERVRSRRSLVHVLALVAGSLAHLSCGGDAGEAGHADAAAAGADAGGTAPESGRADDATSEGGVSVAEGGEAAVAPAEGGEAGADASPPPPVVVYASGYSPRIAWFSVDADTGALTPSGSLASFGPNPSFLAHDAAARHLYAVDESSPGRVGAYAIDPTSGALTFLNAVPSGGDGPAFLSLDGTGTLVLVANYSDGTIAVLTTAADGHLVATSDTKNAGSWPHMIVADPTNRFVFVPCKGSDYVAQYLLDAGTGKLTPNGSPHVATAQGAGPRHLAFHPNGRFAYLINETNSTLTAYALDAAAGTLSAIETYSTVPASFTDANLAAEVWVDPSGRWVVGSNRGNDSLVVFGANAATGKLALVGFTPSGGATPRDFAFDPTGRWLFAADEGPGLVVPFRFDVDHGTLTGLGGAAKVASVTYVGPARL